MLAILSRFWYISKKTDTNFCVRPFDNSTVHGPSNTNEDDDDGDNDPFKNVPLPNDDAMLPQKIPSNTDSDASPNNSTDSHVSAHSDENGWVSDGLGTG